MVLISFHRYLFVLVLLAFQTRRAANIFNHFPRRTRVSMFALGAFFDFNRERNACLVPAAVVIPILRAHFKPAKYRSRITGVDLVVGGVFGSLEGSWCVW